MPVTAACLKDLGAMTGAPSALPVLKVEPEFDAQGRAYGTGRRKSATARVWIKRGTGKITINGRDQETYFARPVLRMVIAQPLIEAGRASEFDVICTVKGSGLMGQAGAVRHGISPALVAFDSGLPPVLHPFGFMPLSPRWVERITYCKV